MIATRTLSCPWGPAPLVDPLVLLTERMSLLEDVPARRYGGRGSLSYSLDRILLHLRAPGRAVTSRDQAAAMS